MSKADKVFEILSERHDKASFDCGNELINAYLKTMANQHAKKGISVTHILADGKQIKGFYTLSCGYLEQPIKGYPNKTPVVLIGRIGVDNRYQGQRLSQDLVRNALHQIKQSSQTLGIAFAVIDAKTEALAQYYERFGFVRLPNGLRLIYPIHQIKH